MTGNLYDSGRRRFIKTGLFAVAATPAAVLLFQRRAGAQDQPKLEESDPAAKALSYVHDASQAKDNAAFQEGAHCANCQLYTGDPEAEWGPCSAFPGKQVNAQGWCSAWVKKAG